LFVDDSINILASAQRYGFEHLLAVENPDSQKTPHIVNDYPSTSDFRTLIDEIKKYPIK
jgi:putative hydrolase of the HAD superfamily